MGADGNIQYISKEKWQKNCPNVKYEDIGLYLKDVCGTMVVAGYWDTNGITWGEYGKQNLAASADTASYWVEKIKKEGIDGILEEKKLWGSGMTKHILAEHQKRLAEIQSDKDYAYSVLCLAAEKWFQDNCETWTVWT